MEQITDLNSVTLYGAQVQQNIADLSHIILKCMDEIDSKELTESVYKAVELLSNKRGMKKQSVFAFFHKKQPFLTKEEQTRELLKHLSDLEIQLEEQRRKLLMNSSFYQNTYKLNQEYEAELERIISDAREYKVNQNGASLGAEQIQAEEQLRRRDLLLHLEHRVEELEMSKTVAKMQAAQIRVLEEYSAKMAAEIQAVLYHLIPIWKNQVAIEKTNEDKEQDQIAVVANRQTSDVDKELVEKLDELIRLQENNSQNKEEASKQLRSITH